MQTRTQITHADTHLRRLLVCRQIWAIVVDRQSKAAVAACTGNLHGTAGRKLGDSVLYGIFCERLKQQARYLRSQQGLGDLDGYLKAVAETDLLDVEIALQVFHFLGESNLRSQ